MRTCVPCVDMCWYKVHVEWQLGRQEPRGWWDKPRGDVLKHFISSIKINGKQLPKQGGWAKRALKHQFPCFKPAATLLQPQFTHTPQPVYSSAQSPEVHTDTFVTLDIQKKSRRTPPTHPHLTGASYIVLSPFPWGKKGCFGEVIVKMKIIRNWLWEVLS